MADANSTEISNCAHCGTPFEKTRKCGRPQLFCSRQCGVDHYSAYCQNEGRASGAHAPHEKHCKVCDKKFPAKPTQIYCSPKCRDSEAKRLSKKRGKVPAPFLGIRSCKTCGSEFEAYKGRREIYCSQSCRNEDRETNSRRLNEAKREQHLEKITGEFCEVKYKTCINCQTLFTERPTKYHDMCCSPGCWPEFQEKHKAFFYRMKIGAELTSIRICPESGYLFKPTSLKQVYFSREYTEAACKRRGVSLRRARIRGADCDSIDPFEVFDAAGWHCEHCGKETPKDKRGTKDHDAPELDHIIPLSKGGSHTLDNVQLLCRQCNSEKSDKLPDEWLETNSSIPMEAT